MATIEVTHTTQARSGVLGYLSLFTSLGTLLCCALPSLLVLLGLGATVATGVSILLCKRLWFCFWDGVAGEGCPFPCPSL
jgi:hypothetical protein